MDTPLELLTQRFEEVTKLHHDLYEALTLSRKTLTAQSLETLADSVSLLNDMEKLSDDMRKECKFLSEAMQKAACMLWVVTGIGKPIRGQRCTASPCIRQIASVPNHKRDPENYQKLMHFMGIPQEHIDDGTVALYWPGMVRFLTARAEQGLPLPDGIEIGKVYETYTLSIRKVEQ